MKLQISNFITQLISFALLTLAAAGLKIDPVQITDGLLGALQSNTWIPFLFTFGLNFVKSFAEWIKTGSQNPKIFFAFLRSTNWWTSALNMGVTVLVYFGFLLPAQVEPSAVDQVVGYALDGNWLLVALTAGWNVLHVLIKRFAPKTAKFGVGLVQ